MSKIGLNAEYREAISTRAMAPWVGEQVFGFGVCDFKSFDSIVSHIRMLEARRQELSSPVVPEFDPYGEPFIQTSVGGLIERHAIDSGIDYCLRQIGSLVYEELKDG